MSTPDGKYYNAAFPFLSACLAISCGVLDERKRFWTDATGFCRKGYGLNDRQTAVALAPTPKFGITPCHPNNDQLDAVLDELAIELSKGKSVKGTLAALDPELERLYPTIISLYKALCVNAGSAPANWRHDLKNEWVEFSAPW